MKWRGCILTEAKAPHATFDAQARTGQGIVRWTITRSVAQSRKASGNGLSAILPVG